MFTPAEPARLKRVTGHQWVCKNRLFLPFYKPKEAMKEESKFLDISVHFLMFKWCLFLLQLCSYWEFEKIIQISSQCIQVSILFSLAKLIWFCIAIIQSVLEVSDWKEWKKAKEKWSKVFHLFLLRMRFINSC